MESFVYSADEARTAAQSLTLLKAKLRRNPVCERFFKEANTVPNRQSGGARQRVSAAPQDGHPIAAPASTFKAPHATPASNIDDSSAVYDEEERQQCPTCNRSFVVSSYEKHQKICYKVFVQKRNAFDSTVMRNADREDAAQAIRKIKDEQKKEAKKPAKKTEDTNSGGLKKWKVQSLQFQASIGNKEAAAELEALKRQGALSQVPGIVEDKVQCNYCGRTFSAEAAKRHIPVCETNAQKTRVTGKSYGPTALKKGGGIQASANVKRR